MWLFLLATTAWASVQVLEPASLLAELKGRSELKAAFASFSATPESEIIGRLTQISSLDLCEVDAPDLPSKDLILLAHRGGCTFLVKALKAQRLGATALLLVDNREEELEYVHMVDPSHSEMLRIPILLISKPDGMLLETALQTAEPVVLRLNLNQPLTSSVSLKLLLSADSYIVLKFLDGFQAFVTRFTRSELQFQPFYALYFDINCRKQNFTECANRDCIGNGRYCSKDSWDLGEEGGRDVVVESLRQICLWRYTLTLESSALWFAYVSRFGEKCLKGTFSEECSKSVLSELDIPLEAVDTCVAQSVEAGGDLQTSENLVLNEETSKLSHLHITKLPGLAVNNEEYRGLWEVETVQELICAQYGEAPKACRKAKGEETGFGAADVLLAALFLALAGWGTWIFREALRNRKESTQVAAAFSQYYSLAR